MIVEAPDFEVFKNDLLLEAESSGVLQATAFFQLYAAAAIENGDIEHIEHCPVRHDGFRKFSIDGYNFNSEQGELILTVSDFRTGEDLETLNSGDVESYFRQVDRFFENSADPEFINDLEDSSPTFEAAYLIHSKLSTIKRVRIVLFSNARISMRKKLATMREGKGVRFSYSVLDFERYIGIQNSRTNSDPIEIDFSENGLTPLPCLLASSNTDDYVSYLVVMPGRTLADIYGLYGARLLEANVRTFLQARTKVNKGIIRTLTDAPHNFFAFNNGLTATASDVTIERTKKGDFIKKLDNLQIVNGGQTTASILYASDKEKADLQDVYVQMKLSVINEDALDEIVPSISRYANTQNKVSEADFFASHAFHLHMERLSRRIPAPPKEGSLVGTKWFYERARGQYKDEQAYMSAGARKKFLTEHPRDQMVVKTDLAKYEMTFLQQPHIVSQGAQKCFMSFADRIDKDWDPDALSYGDGYFRDAMARALIFRWTDKMVGSSGWYKNDRGYKSQIVTYTLATLVALLQSGKRTLDYRQVWARQQVPSSLAEFLEEFAPMVGDILKDAPDNVRNVGEYCKKQACWARLSNEFDFEDIKVLDDCTVAAGRAKEIKKDDRRVRKIDSGIDAQMRVFKLNDRWNEIQEFGRTKRIFTPKEVGILTQASRKSGKLLTEKQSVIALTALDKAIKEGFKL